MKFSPKKLWDEFQKNPCYWVGVIIFLSLFLRIGGSLLINNLFSYLIITLLLYMGFKDWNKALVYAAIILVVINLVHHIGYTREGFDNLDDAIKKLGGLRNKTDSETKPDSDTKTNSETKGIPVVSLNGKKQAVGEFDQLSDEEKSNLYKNLNKEEKTVTRESATAQRDLYQLIDTVKQLQDTVNQLGPTLKEGKKIMDAFENIKLDN